MLRFALPILIFAGLLASLQGARADFNYDRSQAGSVYSEDYSAWQSFEGGYYGGALYWLTNAAGRTFDAAGAALQGDQNAANAYIQAALYSLNQVTNAPNAGLVYQQYPNQVGDTQGIVWQTNHDLGN